VNFRSFWFPTLCSLSCVYFSFPCYYCAYPLPICLPPPSPTFTSYLVHFFLRRFSHVGWSGRHLWPVFPDDPPLLWLIVIVMLPRLSRESFINGAVLTLFLFFLGCTREPPLEVSLGFVFPLISWNFYLYSSFLANLVFLGRSDFAWPVWPSSEPQPWSSGWVRDLAFVQRWDVHPWLRDPPHFSFPFTNLSFPHGPGVNNVLYTPPPRLFNFSTQHLQQYDLSQ